MKLAYVCVRCTVHVMSLHVNSSAWARLEASFGEEILVTGHVYASARPRSLYGKLTILTLIPYMGKLTLLIGLVMFSQLLIQLRRIIVGTCGKCRNPGGAAAQHKACVAACV
jgi:hypothetical protein